MMIVTTPTLEGTRIMQEAAAALGGNAVVGVDIDYENISMGQGGGMLMVSASGTAVPIG